MCHIYSKLISVSQNSRIGTLVPHLPKLIHSCHINPQKIPDLSQFGGNVALVCHKKSQTWGLMWHGCTSLGFSVTQKLVCSKCGMGVLVWGFSWYQPKKKCIIIPEMLRAESWVGLALRKRPLEMQCNASPKNVYQTVFLFAKRTLCMVWEDSFSTFCLCLSFQHLKLHFI